MYCSITNKPRCRMSSASDVVDVEADAIAQASLCYQEMIKSHAVLMAYAATGVKTPVRWEDVLQKAFVKYGVTAFGADIGKVLFNKFSRTTTTRYTPLQMDEILHALDSEVRKQASKGIAVKSTKVPPLTDLSRVSNVVRMGGTQLYRRQRGAGWARRGH